MQCSVHTPSQFIHTHLRRLLPDWSLPAASVVVVLQPSSCNLLEKSSVAEAQKQFLRRQFLQFGCQVAVRLQQMGHLAEVFDPCTGFPLFSRPGSLRLDDVAVARSCLGYSTCDRYGCSVILHPLWGSAVYPSTLLSSAKPHLVQEVLQARELVMGSESEKAEEVRSSEIPHPPSTHLPFYPIPPFTSGDWISPRFLNCFQIGKMPEPV